MACNFLFNPATVQTASFFSSSSEFRKKSIYSAMGPWASFLLFLFLAFEVKIENFSHRWSKQNKNYRQVGVLKLTSDGVGKHGQGCSMPHQVLPRTVLSFSALKQPKIEVESPPWRAKSSGEPSFGKCSAIPQIRYAMMICCVCFGNATSFMKFTLERF